MRNIKKSIAIVALSTVAIFASGCSESEVPQTVNVEIDDRVNEGPKNVEEAKQQDEENSNNDNSSDPNEEPTLSEDLTTINDIAGHPEKKKDIEPFSEGNVSVTLDSAVTKKGNGSIYNYTSQMNEFLTYYAQNLNSVIGSEIIKNDVPTYCSVDEGVLIESTHNLYGDAARIVGDYFSCSLPSAMSESAPIEDHSHLLAFHTLLPHVSGPGYIDTDEGKVEVNGNTPKNISLNVYIANMNKYGQMDLIINQFEDWDFKDPSIKVVSRDIFLTVDIVGDQVGGSDYKIASVLPISGDSVNTGIVDSAYKAKVVR